MFEHRLAQRENVILRPQGSKSNCDTLEGSISEMITDVSLYQTLESTMYVRKTICKYVINQGGTISIDSCRPIDKTQMN